MFAGKMFAVNFTCGNLFLRIAGESQKLQPGKILCHTRYVADSLNPRYRQYMEFFLKIYCRSRVTGPPVCMQTTSLENQKKRDNEIFPWLIFVCVFQSLFFLGKCCSYSSWQKELKQSYCLSHDSVIIRSMGSWSSCILKKIKRD